MRGPLVVTAPAKVNLFLHIGQKRSDGYHDLQSLVAFAGVGDEISLESDDGFSLSPGGPFGAQLSGLEENLALKAAKLFAEKTGTTRGVRIDLRKNLPIASGLGGGSADAAAVLRGLARLWQLNPDQSALLETAELIGADVPVCVASRTSWMEGRGELVHPLPPLPIAGLLLVNPGVHIPTAHAFAALGARHGTGMLAPNAPFPDVYALVHFLRDTKNDLEAPAKMIAPAVADVLQELNGLPGALFACMSGSGATCFALFADQQEARAAATPLQEAHPDWWICKTTFVDNPHALAGLA